VRILVVSDIHGNWPALEAVAAVPHDGVLCLGDIVGYGPEPGRCLRWLRAAGAHIVQGNHDRALADDVPPRCRPDFEGLAKAAAGIARGQLSEEEIAFLRALPRKRAVTLDGKRVLLLHATPAEPLYSYLGPDPERWRQAVAGIDADFLFVGHTHLPFHFELGGLQVVNPGSLGQPKDGDPRAAYAILEDGAPSLKRADYPVERTVEGLKAAGLDPAALEALAALLREGKQAVPFATHPSEVSVVPTGRLEP
jgi:putative phosphoesterase